MFKVRYTCILILFFFGTATLVAQESEKQTLLTTIFSELESSQNRSFSYKDEDLKGAYLNQELPKSFPEILKLLRNKTAFNYTEVDDKVIAVSIKENFFFQCVSPRDNFDNAISNFSISSPYQKLVINQEESTPLLLKENTPITINALGFDLKSQTIYRDENCIPIILEKSIEQLAPILLSNYLTKGIEQKRDGSIVIDYENFDILPGLIEPDVLLTLQALPGVQSVNETVSFLNIRGGTNDQNLILWDGIKMYQSGHFFGQISAFNPLITQNVKLIKNGSSAHFGDGVSGIVNMESNAALNDSLQGSVGLNLISADAFLDIPINQKMSVEVSARKSYNSLIETPTYNQYFDKIFQNTEVISQSDTQSSSNEDFTFFDSSIKLLYKPSEKDLFRFNFIALDNNLDFLENATVDNTLFSRRSELSQNNISSGLYYKRNWKPSVSSDLQFYGSVYTLDATNFDILNNQRLLQTNEVLESGFKTITTVSISDKISAYAGYQFNETGITNFEQINNPFFERTDKQVLRTNSLFAEATFNTKNTSLAFGLRGNHFSKFNDITLEPRLRFNQQFLKYFSFSILGELKSQTTSQIIDFQNDFLGVENRKWVLANPENIPIIKGQQLSLGFTYNRKNLLISVEPYVKHILNITSQSQGFQNQLEETRTVGNYTVRGVDVLLNKQLKKFNTWISYSFAKNTYDFEELNPSVFNNNLDIRHTFTYGLNYNWNNFKVSTGLNWHTGKPTTLPVQGNEIVNNTINFEAPNSNNINDYFRLDVSLLYNFKIARKYNSRFGFSIWNFLNNDNTLTNFFRLNHSDTIEEVNERGLRFTPNLVFRVNF